MNWQLRLIPPLAAFFIRLLEKTTPLRILGESNFGGFSGRNFIYACWHSRLLFLAHLRRYGETAVLISQSRDGELIARTAKRLDFEPVRGSSSEGGISSFRQLLQQTHRGRNIAITPDGPRGPAHKVQDGVIRLARKTGLPIIPFAYNARWKVELSSWDRFIVPVPFGRAVLIYGLPVIVDSQDNIEEKKNELEEKLMRITRQAEDYFA